MINAIMLGLIAGLIPGPVITATFAEILQNGLKKSFRVILVAFAAEATVALISMLILTHFNLPKSVFMIISIIGGIILVWISLSLWKVKAIDDGSRSNFSTSKILLMTATSGMLWTFWITVCIPQAVLLNEQLAFGQYIFLFCVEIGWLISTSAIAIVFSRFKELLSNPKIIPILFKVLAIIFIYFALDMIINSTIYLIKA